MAQMSDLVDSWIENTDVILVSRVSPWCFVLNQSLHTLIENHVANRIYFSSKEKYNAQSLTSQNGFFFILRIMFICSVFINAAS